MPSAPPSIQLRQAPARNSCFNALSVAAEYIDICVIGLHIHSLATDMGMQPEQAQVRVQAKSSAHHSRQLSQRHSELAVGISIRDDMLVRIRLHIWYHANEDAEAQTPRACAVLATSSNSELLSTTNFTDADPYLRPALNLLGGLYCCHGNRCAQPGYRLHLPYGVRRETPHPVPTLHGG